jgi:hypothetical protein
MSWWDEGYAGGPMVPVAGFPRPLYPPDAELHGKTPSSNGPDVEAYKRTVSRAGRWPWQPFDEAYSNGFAHGSSGNVGETGVAGVQRQQGLESTGWIGEKTFNTLRSIRVPEGKPHAGEMAMDASAVSLINEAWALFGGSEPGAGGLALRTIALDLAVGELGYIEGAGNQTKYGAWYGMDGQPWCAMFTTWAYVLAGDVDSHARGKRYAYVPYLVADARARLYGLATTDDPQPGDLVAYDFDGDGEHDHVGLFERWTAGSSTFDAIEGNTSGSSNANGGEVMRRSRGRGGATFIRAGA